MSPAHSGREIPATAAGPRRRRPVQWKLIDRPRMKFLARMPTMQFARFADLSFCLVHATPRDPMDEYLPNDPALWKDRTAGIEAVSSAAATRTTRSFWMWGRAVINPGSVGQPRDRRPRASYAVIEDGRVELRQVEYDIEGHAAADGGVRGLGGAVGVVEMAAAAGGRLTRSCSRGSRCRTRWLRSGEQLEPRPCLRRLP